MSEAVVQESGWLDTIGKFCMDLILGDFEENPSNAAMVINGLIQLIPIAGQVLAARDVCGMIFRISRIGPAKCGKNEWMELAIAAFGCIPEVGGLFKAAVKPLWKGSVALKGSARGSAFVSAMLGKSKGAAIAFIKTFNWAGHTQAAIQQVDRGLTLCDQFLGYLEQDNWWEPASLQGLAHDMRPLLKGLSGPLHTGLQEGTRALREFLVTLLGEDGYAVAQVAASVAASTSGGGRGGAAPTNRAHAAPATTSRARPTKPAEQQVKSHEPVVNTNRQNVVPGGGPKTIATRITRAAWKEIGTRYKGLLGEHMAHYYHMKLHAPGAWPHGTVQGHHPNARWTGAKKLVTEQDGPATPTELVPEHLIRINQSGVDGVWSLGNRTYHFVEAKASESAGAMFGRGASDWKEVAKEEPPASTEAKPKKGKGAKGKSTAKSGPTKLRPPLGMTERQVALWCMLSQPKKGLQMSEQWLRASVDETMWLRNLTNRWVYVYFAIPGTSPPMDYTPAMDGPLKKGMAPGMPEHVVASAEVARRQLTGGDLYDLAIHDKHKADHMPSDIFTVAEIDMVARRYLDAKAAAPRGAGKSDASPSSTPAKTPSRSRRSRAP